MFALILAGGTGTRLWPRSRSHLPKQLMPFFGELTMVQATVNRIAPIVPVEHTFFATNQNYATLIAQQIPNIPLQNIVQEPSAKSTAPCIGLAAAHMQQLDPEAVMASLHADHYIADEAGFRQALLTAEAVARQGYLVTLGITPNKPETGYGYIQRGVEIGQLGGQAVYEVDQFLEKPDLATAERFVADGAYYWNSGIFVWQISTLMDAYAQYLPQLYGQLQHIIQNISSGQSIKTLWHEITPVSIDVGIMEQATKVAVVPVDIGWNDVGSWAATHEISQADSQNNVVVGSDVVLFDTFNSFIESNGRLIAAVGLDNVVIVDTGDALLVCAKDKAQDVKKVVDWLNKNRQEYL